MSCCAPTIVPFYNVASSRVNYTDTLRNTYGNVPKVEVSYFDEDNNEFYISNNQTRVSLSGNPVNMININHGGPASGVIRIV